MKKFVLVIAIAIFGLANVSAQDFKLGINAGLPIGDAGDVSSFNLSVDANYLWAVADQFHAGIAAGYSHSFGEKVSFEDITYSYGDFGYIPIAGAGRFHASEKFTLGLDLGYAIGVSDNFDGGFYYAPKVQYAITPSMDIVVAYRGVSESGGSFDILSAGIEFGL